MGAAEKLKTLHLDREFSRIVTESVVNVFQQGFGLQAKCVEENLGLRQMISGDVSGIVGMVQQRLEGNLILSMPKDTIFAVLEIIYMQKFSAVDDIVRQGTAEITNMIYGQMKIQLNDMGYDFKMAIPGVVTGDNHNIQQVHSGESLRCNFEAAGKKFAVIVAIQATE